jgi:3,4-dihydroxy 2-butanone 4-phosphate synthase/GTP cyclohydrolase II
VIIYHEFATGADHLALIHGRPGGAGAPALVRVHSECLTGDLLGSLRCDCGSQLDHALQLVGEADGGAVIYLRGQEGRGIGLKNKIDAYKLQDGGLDTVDANIALGLPVDARSYSTAAAILHDLSICAVRLITNNDRKKLDLQRSGIEVVEQIFDRPTVTTYNEHYLRTKRDRMGHHIVDLV